MRRRRYLATAATAGAGLLAGCAAGYSGPRDAGTSTGLDLPVAREEMLRAASSDAIPGIIDPAFGADWSGLSLTVRARLDPRQTYDIRPRLDDEAPVIGVERAGTARAYPLSVLNWHEVVNDDLGEPLLVTYCPLCRSGLAAVRRAGGEATRFGVSGLLWRNGLVMYDEATGSLWSQVAATAINGDLTGETLEIVPSTLASWGEWRRTHPGTEVLRPPPESGTLAGPSATRDYRANPYEGYQSGDAVGVAGDDPTDERLHPKTRVVGIEHDGTAKAYAVDAIEREGVINDAVSGLPVVLASTGAAPAAYVRSVDGRPARFSAAGETHVRAAGSRWRRTTGEAVDGPHEGRRLERANDLSPLFWFAWADFHPETAVYGTP